MFYEKRLLVLGGVSTGCVRLERTKSGIGATLSADGVRGDDLLIIVKDNAGILTFVPSSLSHPYIFSLPTSVKLEKITVIVADGERLLLYGTLRPEELRKSALEDDIRRARKLLGSRGAVKKQSVTDFFHDIIPTGGYDDTRVAEVNYYQSNVTQEGFSKNLPHGELGEIAATASISPISDLPRNGVNPEQEIWAKKDLELEKSLQAELEREEQLRAELQRARKLRADLERELKTQSDLERELKTKAELERELKAKADLERELKMQAEQIESIHEDVNAERLKHHNEDYVPEKNNNNINGNHSSTASNAYTGNNTTANNLYGDTANVRNALGGNSQNASNTYIGNNVNRNAKYINNWANGTATSGNWNNGATVNNSSNGASSKGSEGIPVPENEASVPPLFVTAPPVLDTASFYDTVKPQLDKLFGKNEHYALLEKLLPDSKWIRVDYDSKGKYYLVGLVGSPVRYICYGVPGKYSPRPPAELAGYCQWLAIDEQNPIGDGFWVMYQDAISGRSVL